MSKRRKFKMPDLSNATPTFLVDELGKLREQASDLKKLEGVYKQALMARLNGKQVVEGEEFVAMISSEKRTSLDTSKIKEEMDDDWVQEHSRTTEFKKISTKRVETED
jgi:hypothetical protein